MNSSEFTILQMRKWRLSEDEAHTASTELELELGWASPELCTQHQHCPLHS